MKRSIYVGRIVPARAKQDEEMQAVADASNLLANIAMAWNTIQTRAALQAWAERRGLALHKTRRWKDMRIKHLAYPSRTSARFQHCGYGSKNKRTRSFVPAKSRSNTA